MNASGLDAFAGRASAAETSGREAGEPALSVIVNCYNYEAFVGRAIASVTTQDRADVELIVVDDGSSDASWDIITACAEEAEKRGRPMATYRLTNRGQSRACLYGFERSRAPFILFLDADDELVPGSIETIFSHLDDKVAKLQYPLQLIDAKGRHAGGLRPLMTAAREREVLVERVLQTGSYLTPPTSGNVLRRDVCEYLREASYDRAVDGVILFMAPFHGDVVTLSEPLALYRLHDRNKSGVNRAPDASIMARDIKRFSDRMDHMRIVLEPMGLAHRLVPTNRAYYHLETSLHLAIASGYRPKPALVARLIRELWRQDKTLGTKAAFTGFFGLAAVLPSNEAKRALTWRLSTGKRSPMGLLRALAGR